MGIEPRDQKSKRRRARNRNRADSNYEPPWILKDHWGAPTWAIIGFMLIVGGIFAFALLRH